MPDAASATVPVICSENVAAMEVTLWVLSAARLIAVRGVIGAADDPEPATEATKANAPAQSANAAARRPRRPAAVTGESAETSVMAAG